MANVCETKEKSSSQALSFTVEFDEPKKKPKRIPKNLTSDRQKRQALSHASLAEKQRLAEERRKKLIEDRIERIHQMEQEAMNLAKAMDPLFKMQSKGSCPPNGQIAAPVTGEALKAAKEVTTLNSKVVNDITRVEKGTTS